MPKGLVVDDSKRYMDLPESFIRLREQLGDVKIAEEKAEKVMKSHLTQVPQPLHEAGGVFTPETRPRKYVKPKTLKQIILESEDPKLTIYKRLLESWPQISESKLKEIIENVSPDRLSRVLDLAEAMGKNPEYLEQFLARNLTINEVDILDNLYRHYFLLAPKYSSLIKDLRDGVKISLEIDSKKYDFEVFFLVDGIRMPIDFYADGWRKTLGLEYRFIPCLEKIKKRIHELTSIISEKAELEKIEQLKYALIDLEIASREIIKLNPQNVIGFPPRFNIHRFYVSEQVQPIPCEYCGKKHVYTLIMKW